MVFSLMIGPFALPAFAQEAEATAVTTTAPVAEVTAVTTAIPVAEVASDEAVDLATNEEDVEGISDEELLEPEPSELPEEAEDSELTKKMYGKMLLDVEGNGEVYYVDPVTGGKEYLANGFSAYRLLERRALGITEDNFAKLIQGDAKEDSSVCEESEMGKRLQGRIVLRVEKNGEAYWINPNNCRAYYTGTYDAAYRLMKNYSLGIKKQLLAKVRNNQRQKVKTAYRYSVYAYAEDNDVDLKTARVELKAKITAMHACMKDAGFNSEAKKTLKARVEQAQTCATDTGMPMINKERRMEVQETIKTVREENQGKIQAMKKKIKEVASRAREMLKKRREMMKKNMDKKRAEMKEKREEMKEEQKNMNDKEVSEDTDGTEQSEGDDNNGGNGDTEVENE